ncbi:hypothetical protein BGX23_003433 [Mortierella sp. AD031]|nr:hypothetical protein BGX23_003433 [Mortierella sp. AD031]
MSRAEYMSVLLDCILFELVATTCDKLPLQDLANVYGHIYQVFTDNPASFSFPCDHNIYLHQLFTIAGIRRYLNRLVDGHGPLFPYPTFVHSYGYTTGDDDFVDLPAFRGRQTQDFLQQYAETIPHVYHDDIAILIQALRDNHWWSRGSGGPWDWIGPVGNVMRGAVKFSSVYNANKRRRSGRLQPDELAQQQALIQRQQQLEAERQEHERRRQEQKRERQKQKRERQEQELQRQLEEARILWEKIVEEERQHQLKQEEEARRLREIQAKEQQRLKQEQKDIKFPLDYRNAVITKYINKLKTQRSDADRQANVEGLRESLESNLRFYSGDPAVVVHIFGSFASGLSSITSDADFTVYNFARNYKDPITELAKILRKAMCGNVVPIPNARVPIVSFTARGFDCDMNLDQPMGVLNSKLIATYTKCDERFPKLWFGLRQLAKRHGILSGSTRYLSSYALTMMLIVYLQGIANPPVLPRLQLQLPRFMVSHHIGVHNCSFDHQWRRYTDYGSGNTMSTGALFMGFLHYYGYVINYATQEINPKQGVVRARTVNPPTRSATDLRPQDWPICIMDPFNTHRNVAGNCHANNVAEIQQCFQSAYKALNISDVDKAFKR